MPKLILTFILTVIISVTLSGQPESSDSIGSFYKRHFSHIMGDTFKCSEQKKYGYVIVKTDLKDFNCVFMAGRNKMNFIPDTSSMNPFWIKPFHNNIGRYYFTVRHKYIATDTVDIYDGEVSVSQAEEYRENKHTKPHRILGLSRNSCKGTCGYIADGRFIFLPSEKKWVYFKFKNDCQSIKMIRVDD